MSRYEIEVNIEARNRASKEFKQLERDINRVQRESQDATQATGGFSSALGGLGAVAAGVGAAFAAMEIARVGLDMAQAGEAAINTANRFRDLTGGAVEAAAGLETLRKATRGMVTDTELMAGASRLLQMGIASSVDDAARLVEIAIALKQPSDSAAQAIENLSLMIANTSYLRLDSLGLSATNVRDRVEELKDAGMGLQEAFAQAVIEEAADSMDRLADSTAEAETNLSKLQVRFGNFMGVVNEATFSIAEFIATYPTFGDVLGQSLGSLAELRADTVTANISERVEQAERFATYAVERGAAERTRIREQEARDAIEAQERVIQAQRDQQAEEARIADEAENERVRAIRNRATLTRAEARQEVENMRLADQYFASIAARDPLVSESEVDNMGRFADEAERSSVAMRTLTDFSLSELFQTGPGGGPMDMARMVADLMPEEAAADFLSAMAMATGEASAISQEFKSNWGPLLAQITEELGVDAGVAAAMGIASGLRQGLEAGALPQDVVDAINRQIPVQMTAAEPVTIDVPFNVGANWVRDNLGMTMTELESASATAVRNGILQVGQHEVLMPGALTAMGPFQQQPGVMGFQQQPIFQTGLFQTQGEEQQTPLQLAASNLANMNTDLLSVSQTAAETDFNTMSTGMQTVADNAQEAYDNLTTLIDTEWVATVALDFVILDGTKWGQLPGFTNAVQDIMRSSTRDNGGVPVGANQGSMRQGG